MKTTLEIPDALFRRAKALAARDGKTLKQFVNEALEQELRARTSPAKPEWAKYFGAIRGQSAALRRIDATIADEFERIDPEDWK